jgi:hypothetical protein
LGGCPLSLADIKRLDLGVLVLACGSARLSLSTRLVNPRTLPPRSKGAIYAFCPLLTSSDRCGAAVQPGSGADPTAHRPDQVDAKDDHDHKEHVEYNAGARGSDRKVARLLEAGRLKGAAWQTAQKFYVEL